MLDLLFQRARDTRVVARQDCRLRVRPAAPVPHAEVRIGLSDGAALFPVGLKQPRRSPALQDRRELPSEVVDVLDARVGAEAAGGREAVSGIAAEENAPNPKAFGHLRRARPERDIDELDRQVWNT